MNKPTVTISEIINLPVNQVWDFFNNPVHIINWNFASPDWHCPKAENDLKVGGKLKSRMEAKDGSFGFDFAATYEEIIPNQKIVYRLDDNRLVNIEFKENQNQTAITTTFEIEDQNPAEMQRSGWQAILTNLKKYAEN